MVAYILTIKLCDVNPSRYQLSNRQSFVSGLIKTTIQFKLLHQGLEVDFIFVLVYKRFYYFLAFTRDLDPMNIRVTEKNI